MWGFEHLDITSYCHRIKEAGYDGLDTWIPENPAVQRQLFEALQKEELLLVSHQHQARGEHFEDFKESFLHYLEFSTQGAPLLINSHTGKDHFSFRQNLELIDLAAEFSYKKGFVIAHETHRGRVGFHPGVMQDYFDARPELVITADLSHWVCTSESFLDNFQKPLEQAIHRARHIHARVGFEEGPQIPDPRGGEWKYAMDKFFGWWDSMVESRRKSGAKLLTFTTEFGPPPYMPMLPFKNEPVADQFEVNSFMKDLLRQRYGLL